MARIRSIKPEFWTDSLMVQMPPLVRLLYIGLWTAADDHGCLADEPDRLCMEIMPREDAASIEAMIDLLIACDRITRQVADDGSTYLQIHNWTKHQRVDKPSKSRFPREGSRKFAIPAEARRKIAQRYQCEPGGEAQATCYFCGAPGSIWWPKLHNGRPGGWVAFSGLEIDHVIPEHDGGETSEENLVLSCRACNRSRGTRSIFEYVSAINAGDVREHSRMFPVGKEGEGKGKGEDSSEPNGSGASAPIDFEKLAFERGKAVLGKSAGGVIAKLKRDKCKTWHETLSVIEQAATKASPMEWVQGLLKAADPDAEIYRFVQ